MQISTIHSNKLPIDVHICVLGRVSVQGVKSLGGHFAWFESYEVKKKIRLFPIISISQNFFSIFFLTLEKIGIDEKVICYHNISN